MSIIQVNQFHAIEETMSVWAEIINNYNIIRMTEDPTYTTGSGGWLELFRSLLKQRLLQQHQKKKIHKSLTG